MRQVTPKVFYAVFFVLHTTKRTRRQVARELLLLFKNTLL